MERRPRRGLPRAAARRVDVVSAPLLEVRGLRVEFADRGFLGSRREAVQALRGVDLALDEGRSLGVVGESGCGKSTLARVMLGLVAPSAGEVRWRGWSVDASDRERMRLMRRELQVVFQDPFGSLDPRMTAGASVAEALDALEDVTDAATVSVARRRRARVGRPRLGPRVALSARTVRRAVPAGRDRAGHDRASAAPHLRRGRERARRVRAGADRQPARGPVATAGHRAPVHQPQPRRGPAPLRRGGGALPRARRRARAQGRPVLDAPPPVHARAARRRAGAGSSRRIAPCAVLVLPEEGASRTRPSTGCTFRAEVPARHRCLLQPAAAARAVRPGRRRRLPPLAGAACGRVNETRSLSALSGVWPLCLPSRT